MPKRTWPTSLARIVLRAGYAESIGSQLKSSQPAVGPRIVRRMAGKYPDTVSATLFFDTYDDFIAFRTWFDDVETGLAGGLYVVEWTHPITKKVMNIRFVAEDEKKFGTAQPSGNAAFAWQLPVTLEVMP